MPLDAQSRQRKVALTLRLTPRDKSLFLRQAVQRRPPVPVRFELRLVPLLLWRVLERRGVAEPLVYSSAATVPNLLLTTLFA